TQAINFNQNNNANRASSFNLRGLVYSEMQLNEKALADYRQAIQINERLPNRASGLSANYTNAGNSYSAQYNYSMAQASYEKAISLDPQSVIAKGGLARCLRRKLEFGKAMKLCDEAIKIAPDYDSAYEVKGLIYVDTQEFYQAYLALNKGAEVSLNDSNLKAYLGFSRLLCKDNATAGMIFTQLLKADVKKVMDVPEHYVDNKLDNKRFNKENSSSITTQGEKLCQFGMRCIAYVKDETETIFTPTQLKGSDSFMFVPFMMGFIQVYSTELPAKQPLRFKRLCEDAKQIITEYAKDDKSPLVANYAERLLKLIAYTDTLLAASSTLAQSSKATTDKVAAQPASQNLTDVMRKLSVHHQLGSPTVGPSLIARSRSGTLPVSSKQLPTAPITTAATAPVSATVTLEQAYQHFKATHPIEDP
ncbi:MAG: tetratricopeptide repeat protein, partial [Burkholderiales bacterium]